MRKAGLTDYAEFAQRLLERVTDHPISFEVFADDADEMRRQARDRVVGRERLRQDSGDDDRGRVAGAARAELSDEGVKVNVTAMFTTARWR